MLNQFTRSTVGQDLIEYALLCATLAMASWIAWGTFGPTFARAVNASSLRTEQLNACTPNPLGGVRGGQCEP